MILNENSFFPLKEIFLIRKNDDFKLKFIISPEEDLSKKIYINLMTLISPPPYCLNCKGRKLVYQSTCDRMRDGKIYGDRYIGETFRSLAERVGKQINNCKGRKDKSVFWRHFKEQPHKLNGEKKPLMNAEDEWELKEISCRRERPTSRALEDERGLQVALIKSAIM